MPCIIVGKLSVLFALCMGKQRLQAAMELMFNDFHFALMMRSGMERKCSEDLQK